MAYSLTIDQLAVGQGESAIIIIKKGKKIEKTLLIDGGKAEGNLNKIKERYLTLAGDEHKLDFIITSHYDDDHFLGIQKLITNNDDYELIGDKTKFYDHGAPFDSDFITKSTYPHYQKCILNFLKDRVIKESKETISLSEEHINLLTELTEKTLIESESINKNKTRSDYLSPENFNENLSKERRSGLAKEVINFIDKKIKEGKIKEDSKDYLIEFINKLLKRIENNWPTHTSPKKGNGILYNKELLELDGEDSPKLKCIYNYTQGKNENNKSLAFVLTLGDFKFYTAGDLESEIENNLIENLKGLSVFKAGHHGSEKSTSEDFLSTTRPVVCLISCGKNNSYGHPNENLIDRLVKSKDIEHVYMTEYGNEESMIYSERYDEAGKLWLAGDYISKDDYTKGSYPGHICVEYQQGEKFFSVACIERDRNKSVKYAGYRLKAYRKQGEIKSVDLGPDGEVRDVSMLEPSASARGKKRPLEDSTPTSDRSKRSRTTRKTA